MKSKSRRRRSLLFTLLVLIGAALAWVLLERPAPLDTRFTGTYRLEDGRLVFVTPREADTLRYRLVDGESAALRPVGERTFEAGPGWSEAEPVEVTVTFDPAESSPPPGLTWSAKGSPQRARRIELPEVAGSFMSGDIELRAKLVLPQGEGPFPAVVFVHGSGKESAVDTYYNPYLTAAHGVAGLAYDKRGTGESGGRYTQNFYVLSDDVAAAVAWLRTRPEIDSQRIHLAGYSQGGWIAPLAATKTAVRSLLIGYGPMVPVTGEDRWGWVYALREAGFGEKAVRQVDAIDAVVGRIFDHGENRWGELAAALEAVEDAPWLSAVRGSGSMVGFLTDTWMPLWMVRLYAWWITRGDVPFIDRLYDPVPSVAGLDVPSLWIFGGEDSSMPTEWSIAELRKLQSSGRPISIELFPAAEHGILLFDEAADGERTYRGYASGYHRRQVEWLRQNSDLAPLE